MKNEKQPTGPSKFTNPFDKDPLPLIKLMVSGILIHKGKLLLGKRVLNDKSFPGMWCTPGGGVEFGETLVDALKREFVEEVHLRIEPTHPTPTPFERIADGRHTVGMFWRVRLTHPDCAEVGDGFCEIGLFGRDDLKNNWSNITQLTQAALEAFNFSLDVNNLK